MPLIGPVGLMTRDWLIAPLILGVAGVMIGGIFTRPPRGPDAGPMTLNDPGAALWTVNR